MLPSHKPLPFPYRIVNALGEQAERWGLRYTDLDIDRMQQAAARATGLTDFGDPNYQTGLKKLLVSLKQDVEMHFLGRFVMCTMLNNYLCQRLLFIAAQKHTPELFQTELIPPLIITGLNRSGTTFMHRLLSADPDNYGVPFWRLYRPFAAPGRLDLRRLLAFLELNILQPMRPGMDVRHVIRTDAPEETIWMMGLTFQSIVFWVEAPVSGYLDWLMTADWSSYYQEYGMLIHALQAVAPGKRLVLKLPDHMPHLDLLLNAIPTAQIIQLHRDPETCIISLCSLLYSNHRVITTELHPAQLANLNSKLVHYYLTKNEKVRQETSSKLNIFDIDYDTFVGDPIKTAEDIYERFGLNWTEQTGNILKTFTLRHSQGKHRHHVYKREQFTETV